MEGLLSTGPTPSSLHILCIDKRDIRDRTTLLKQQTCCTDTIQAQHPLLCVPNLQKVKWYMQTINLRDTGGQSGPDSGTPCSLWAKGGGLLCPAGLEEMESEHIPPLNDCLHSPFPSVNRAEQSPSFGPGATGCPTAVHCQAHWRVFGASVGSIRERAAL